MSADLPPPGDYSDLMGKIVAWESGQAEFLGRLLDDVLRPRSVIDFGCGPGIYLLPFLERGCSVLGVDLEPAAGQSLPDHFVRADLRLPFVAMRLFRDEPYDLALCIEMAENLPAEFAPVIVQTCTFNARTVFWSAARPGQGGLYHVNEQPAEYWERLFAERAYGPHPQQAAVQAAIAADPECQKVEWLLHNARLFAPRSSPNALIVERGVAAGET